MLKCEFCRNELNSLSSLNKHKKTNKKCLEIQQKTSDNVHSKRTLCKYCGKNVSNVNRHFLTCKSKKEKDNQKLQSENDKLQSENDKLQSENENLRSENENLRSENGNLRSGNKNLQSENEDLRCVTKKFKKFKKENNELKETMFPLKTENDELKELIFTLKAENNIYKKDHETVTSMAKQPKINTNNTNTYNLSVYDDNIIKDRFILAINNAKPSDLYGGQKSIGKFVAPCLKNDDGTSMISCTDSSRNVFVYKDSAGNINKDIKCKNLANLIEPIATAKVDELIKVDNGKRYKITKIERLKNDIIKRQDEIKSLEEHILGFRKDSTGWKQVMDRICKKEDSNEQDFKELEKLQNDENDEVEEQYIVFDYDEKLADAAEDIKEMKTDSCKFSKTISELV